MPSMKCPRCSTVVAVAPGAAPVCPACGFGADSAPAAPPTAPTPMTQAPPAPAPALGGFGSPAPELGSMVPIQRPGLVTFAAVIEFIGAGLAIVAGLLFMFGGALFAALFAEVSDELAGATGVLFVVAGLVALLFATLLIFIGIGLLKGQSWARIVAIVFAAIGLLFGILSLVSGDAEALLPLAVHGLVLFALIRPASAAWFRDAAMQGR